MTENSKFIFRISLLAKPCENTAYLMCAFVRLPSPVDMIDDKKFYPGLSTTRAGISILCQDLQTKTPLIISLVGLIVFVSFCPMFFAYLLQSAWMSDSKSPLIFTGSFCLALWRCGNLRHRSSPRIPHTTALPTHRHPPTASPSDLHALWPHSPDNTVCCRA